MIELRLGYVPLVDAAVAIAAAEGGFAEREGLRLVLERESSWATLRDKLLLGIVDVAHLLAPLAVATTLGLSPGGPVPLVAPFVLSLNGNAITLSRDLWSALDLPSDARDPAPTARALGRVLHERAAARRPPATFATVFPFSSHTYQLRAFLRLGGIDPDRDVRISVVPPPYAAEALRTGVVDGFCVGAPWNSVAVEHGSGRIAALCSALTPNAPEKMVAWPRGRLAPDVASRLLAALDAAAGWCADPARRGELAGLLGESRHLGLDPVLLLRVLDGRLRVGPDVVIEDPAYLRLGPEIRRPAPAQADWIMERMAEAAQVVVDPQAMAAARAVFDDRLVSTSA